MINTITVAGTCPVCSRTALVADVNTNVDTGATSATVRCSSYACRASGKSAPTWRQSFNAWVRQIADDKAAAKAKADAEETSGKPLSEKNLKIRMKRIDRYVKLVIPAVISAEKGDLKDEKVQRNIAIRAFNFARKLAAKRGDVYKQVKAGELV